MRLIKGGPSLDLKLVQLTKRHENLAFAVAWASPGTNAFEAISSARMKIRKAVIGTHFYQTHPDVLEDFADFENIRFVLQPQGVFHPKVFLFWSELGWDLLIGSANLTNGALTQNTELLLHVSSNEASDDSEEDLRKQTEEAISGFWEEGEIVTKDIAQTYRGLWQAQQSALRRVSGTYSSARENKAPAHTEVMAMSWLKFLAGVEADPHHGFKERCELLSLVRDAFERHEAFSDMELNTRKTIAGLPNDWNAHWGWFGSMRGAGYYHQAINENNLRISAALDYIPLEGPIVVDHYRSYIKEFVLAFPNGRHSIGVASRLLALKRPDYFVCLDSKNKAQLCSDFGIRQYGMDYNRYWDDVICRIMDSVWWNSPKPKQKEATQVWMGRAAMLDALFYQP